MSTLGGLLIKKAMLTPEQLVKVKSEQQAKGGPLVTTLVRSGAVKDDDLLMCLHQEYRLPVLDLQSIEPSSEVLRLVPPNLAQKHHVLPISRNGSVLTLAVADPSNFGAFNEIKFLCGCDVKVVLAHAGAIEKAIAKHYSNSAQAYEEVLAKLEAEKPKEQVVNIDELQRASEDAPVVKLVSTLMSDAITQRASDIHIEPYEDGLRVRFRIDGVLHEVMQPPDRLKAAIASRIKVMAAMDIAERRLPQDGIIKVKPGNGNPTTREINFRVSVLPTVFGEKVVLRLLRGSDLQYDVAKLGMEEESFRLFRKAIAEPSGMVLVTGPTGSGKTTTLYSALAALNKEERNISSAEDPVEIYMRGINQVKIQEDIGLTFAAVLRSLLRQDPDVMMVGEIRDFETIEIAVKAALTGHLVLSTLHTNDAPSTIGRMLNMGVDAFLVSSSVNLIVAQRLARVICPQCKSEVEDCPAEALLDVGFAEAEIPDLVIYKGRGCEDCAGTGYRGRLAFYEVMSMTEEVRAAIIAHASTDELRKMAIAGGMVPLRLGGLQKVREGQTTIEEVLRVTASESAK
jgi:type IV pilus assembly protein PilB